MKKTKQSDNDMPAEIDLRGGERGRYAKRFVEGTNLVVLAPDVAEVFPNSAAVNSALRVVLRASAQASPRRKGKRRAG